MNYFLGLEVVRSSTGLVLTQTKYITDLLAKTNMSTCKSVSTPISTTQKLALHDSKPFEHASLYRSTIGALQYLTYTKLDLSFIVNKLG